MEVEGRLEGRRWTVEADRTDTTGSETGCPLQVHRDKDVQSVDAPDSRGGFLPHLGCFPEAWGPSGVFLPQQECLRPSREGAHSSRRRPCIQDLNSLALMEWEPAPASPPPLPLVQMVADPTNRGQRGSEGQLWGSGPMWVARMDPRYKRTRVLHRV